MARLSSILATLGLAAAAASGQNQADQPLRISRAEFQQHVLDLDMAVAQREAADAMFADYEREFDDAAEAHDQFLNWLWTNYSSEFGGQPEQQSSDEMMFKGMVIDEHWQGGARELERGYFQRLAALTPGREAQVAALQRSRLRHRVLTPYMNTSVIGAGVDLVAILQEISPIQRDKPKVALPLNEYELRMDDLLKALDGVTWRHRRAYREPMAQARKLIAAGEDAGDLVNIVVDQMVRPSDLTWQIRQLNLRSVETIAATLDRETAAAFRKAAHRLLYAYMYQDEPLSIQELIDSTARRLKKAGQPRGELMAVAADYESAMASATPEVARLYERTINPQTMRLYWQAFFKDYGKPDRHYEPADLGEEEFKAARQRWLDRCQNWVQRIPTAPEEVGKPDPR